MQAAVWQRQQATVGMALATVGLVAVAPVMPVMPIPGTVSAVERALRLVNSDAAATTVAEVANNVGTALSTVAGSAAGDSIFNIPLNLFQQIVNIPYNEIWAMQMLGNSLISSGNWFQASATNIWGEDPGDPLHFMAVIDMLFPFKAISGIGMAEPGVGNNGAPWDPSAAAGLHPGDFGYVSPFSFADAASGHLGLSQQVTLLMNQLLPVNAATDADNSIPIYPAGQITGNVNIDKNFWFLGSAGGAQQFPYFTNLTQVTPQMMVNGVYKFPEITPENVNQVINGTYVPNSDLTPAQMADRIEAVQQGLAIDKNGFLTPNAQGMIDPSQGVGVNGQVPDNGVFQTAGTHPMYVSTDEQAALEAAGTKFDTITLANNFYNPDGTLEFAKGTEVLQLLNDNGNGINLMPWEGMTVKLDMLSPFVNEWNSLTAPIGSDYFSGFTLPSLVDIYQAFGSLLAGMLIAFDPFVAGSLFCPGGPCMIPDFLQLPSLVKALSFFFPGNTSIDQWLKLYGTSPTAGENGGVLGMTNSATQHQIDAQNNFSSTIHQTYNGGNPVPYTVENLDGHQVVEIYTNSHTNAIYAYFDNATSQWVAVDPTTGDATGEALTANEIATLTNSVAFSSTLDTPSHFQISPALQAMIDAAQANGTQDFWNTVQNGYQAPPIIDSHIGPDGITGSIPPTLDHDWLTQLFISLGGGNWIGENDSVLNLLGLNWLFLPA